MNREHIPEKIQEVIERSRQAILEDQKYNLSPYYRSLIYSFLGPRGDEEARLRCGKLAIIAVVKVLPIWENEWPIDRRPHELLANAEDVLAGRVPPEEGRLIADTAFDEMAEL